MNNKEIIEQLIERVKTSCLSWVRKGEDGLDRFVDPIDGKEISAHYGATHAAASFILWGHLQKDDDLYGIGISLLKSVLVRWNNSKNLPAFHFDFNNLALTIIADFVDKNLSDQIKHTVLTTSDSNHDTINWLPMRWEVNRKRMEWSGDNKYQISINRCKKIITEATNADGGIEDHLPHGMSYNLQYNVATLAALQYLNVLGENIELSKQLGFLLNVVCPDGDINYLGRGTNQVFAWGLWVYLLASSGQQKELQHALNYLTPLLPSMLKHNNMMLNDWEGKEKYLWWDYHYTSVYTAHCLMWLVLAYRDIDKKIVNPVIPDSTETGVHIFRSDKVFISWFEGRSEYLAEKGPVISAIWTKNYGAICKGTFGPWQGAFGNNYSFEDAVLKNYCGVLSIKRNTDWRKHRLIHRLFPSLQSSTSLTVMPQFSHIEILENDNIEIVFQLSEEMEQIFNLPSMIEGKPFVLFADDKELPLYNTASIRNQYQIVYLLQCRSRKAKKWALKILL